jgi:serine-protein kinase ATM
MSQFVQIQDTEFQEHESIERSVQERLQNIYGDASFREFVDVLCRFSRKFDSMGQEPTSDKDFKGMRPQITLSSSTLDESWALRDISRYSFTLDGWRMQLLVRLHTEVHIRDEPIRSLTPYYFRTLETHNLLLAGENVARTIFWFNDDTSQSATEEFLDAFKTDIASTYNWGGNEITTNIAMALISSSLKSIDPNSHIAGLVTQLYRWIVKVVVNRELSSATARLKAVMLLREVSEFDIEYGKEAKSESRAGVLLIKLLRDLDVRVKFDLANHVKSTFLHFPLVDQIDVYRDIVDNLESDETYSEGFALRAYTLMQLAFASDDIRRAAMVNLLELGKFVSSKLTVHSCFVFLAEHLYRGQLADLFFQNSSQFLCSWIDFEEKIFEFPFHAFGFPDFEFWSASVKDELIAQLVNANRWDDAITIFRASNHFEDTLLSCLPRIVSYHYLHTAELSEMNGIDSAGSIPERCKAVLGADLYVSTLTSRFALSLAIMVERMDDKTLSVEAFDSLGLSTASATLSAIALPDPGPTYPQPSQPSFAIRNVLTAVESLRRALHISSSQVWTASNTVFVLRQLFDKGIVVSDTTVALCFLRRIVFVLCLARDVISDGYPLEMLFFNLRAFLAHSSLVHASTMQIVKAIFGLGTKFLSGHPDRLRHIVASLLPHFHSLHSTSHKDDDFTSEDYGWLKTFIQTVLPGDSSLHAMTSLLGILNKYHKADAKSVGQIVEDVILEDESLWAESDLYSFSLRLLSFESDVFLEPLSTLTHLVPHFLSSDRYLMDPPTSKRWLGVALGRISRDATFLRPENRTKKVGHRSQKTGDLSNSSSFAVLSEVLRFMRSDSSIAGLLEQALRNVSSLSPFRIPSKFGVDQFIVRSLSSPHIECKSYFHDSLAFPPPSKLDAWTKLDQRFVDWQKSLARSVALHLPNQFFKFLVPAIDASLDFCRVVFPYLIDEYCCQNEYDGSITMIFNNILRVGDTIDRDYSRLVIRLILFLREREPKTHSLKRQALVDDIDYLHAANAAVACNMYKTSLMFLEIAGKQEMSSSQQFAEQILSEVYRNVDDPDMTYALSKGINRSWNQLLDVYKLHHDRERVHELRRARLRGKVELGITPSFEDDDLRAVADLIRQNGFPLKAEGTTLSLNTSGGEDSSVSLYRSAWRLGNWDLPPTARSQETDTLLYTVLFHLVHANPLETFFPVLDSAIVQVVDRLSSEFNSAVHSKSTFCLSMLADLADLFSNSQPTMVARHWMNQILQDACYGR